MSQKYRVATAEVAHRQNSGRQKAAQQIGGPMERRTALFQLNASHAQAAWGVLSENVLQSLKEFSERHSLQVAAGELQLLDNRWYVTHAGLLRIAQRRRCSGIKTVIQDRLCDPPSGRWVFRATVYKTS